MSIRRKLQILAFAAGGALGTLGVAAIPSASADQCKVTVTLVTGQTLTFQVNAPPGTPASQMVPAGTGPVKNVTASCSSTATTTTGRTTTTPTTATTTTTTTTTTTPPPTKNHGGGSGKHPSKGGSTGKGGPSSKPGSKPGHKKSGSGSKKTNPNSKKPSSKKKKSSSTTSTSTTTTPSSPAAFAIPGASPFGVPNFFIDSFQIPPFLLPIYQAAGIEYNVPWQILAAINEIETDYGRNLSVSSAGAVGWMQFLPSTWKLYGMDVTGTGYADPYNPVDAIFAAARYLHAAGASKNLSKAIYSYNHASWYVQSVELRARLIGGMPNQLIGTLTGLVEGRFPVAAVSKYADSAVTKVANQHVQSGNAAIAVHSNPTSTATNIFAKAGSPVIAVNDGKVIKMGHNQQWGNYLELQDSTGNIYTYTNLGSISKTYPVPKAVSVTKAQIAQQLTAPAGGSSKSSPTTTPSAPSPSGPATAGGQQSKPATASSLTSHPAFSLPVTTNATTTKAPASAGSSPSAGSSASAGTQTSAPTQKATKVSTKVATTNSPPSSQSNSSTIPTPMPKERLFADPYRPASWAAGGDLQVQHNTPALSSFNNYFANVLHLPKNQYTLQPLKAGATVIAGTVLGKIGQAQPGRLGAHLRFMIRPAGNNAPYIDPKPILDGWKLLAQTNVYRAEGTDPFAGAKKPATIGQILLMSKEQLAFRVLTDPHVSVYACGRRDIEAGLVDRRILAVIEFLSASKLYPNVSGLVCGNNQSATSGVDPAGATGASLDISNINGTPILHHQGTGSITDTTIRQLLTLQGVFQPDAIVSTMSFKGHTNTFSMQNHADRIQVSYTPLFGQNTKLSTQLATLLKPGQWIQLINRISQIPEPIVPIAPSKYAIKVRSSGATP